RLELLPDSGALLPIKRGRAYHNDHAFCSRRKSQCGYESRIWRSVTFSPSKVGISGEAAGQPVRKAKNYGHSGKKSFVLFNHEPKRRGANSDDHIRHVILIFVNVKLPNELLIRRT